MMHPFRLFSSQWEPASVITNHMAMVRNVKSYDILMISVTAIERNYREMIMIFDQILNKHIKLSFFLEHVRYFSSMYLEMTRKEEITTAEILVLMGVCFLSTSV